MCRCIRFAVFNLCTHMADQKNDMNVFSYCIHIKFAKFSGKFLSKNRVYFHKNLF